MKYLPIFNVPFSRKENFVGQKEILDAIYKSLVLETKPDMTSRYVLCGLGGIGKTRIALEFSYLHRNEFDIIYWLRADNYNMLLKSYFELYCNHSMRSVMDIDLGDEKDPEIIAKQIKSWFENHHNISWLLIIDNADELERVTQDLNGKTEAQSLASLIPKGQNGCVLVTSRSKAAKGWLSNKGQEVPVMNKDDAMSFLIQRSCITSEWPEAVSLVEMLGRLPLAIEQAASYMRERGISIGKYQNLFKSNASELLKKGLSSVSEYYRQTVATTWNISIMAIKEMDPLANVVLQISAFLDGKEIQKDLFYDACLMVAGKEIQTSELTIIEAFKTLMNFSLVRQLEGKESVEMHLSVQGVMQNALKAEEMALVLTSAELVNKRFPWGGDVENLRDWNNYISQAQTCLSYAQNLQIKSPAVINLLESTAGYFDITGRYTDAFFQYSQALRIKESEFGINQINSAGTLLGLGNVSQSQGKYSDAIGYYQRALRIYENAFGVDRINTADTINNLGNTYDSQGKYDKAIAQYERALRIYENAFGVDHINTADTIMNMGLAHVALGCKLLGKEELTRGYELFQRNLGPNHPSTLKAKAHVAQQIASEIGIDNNDTNTTSRPKIKWTSKLRNAFFK